jgi:hypothetical protein
MDIIHFVADTITAALKHGWSLTTFVLVIVALFRIQSIQNMLLRRLPKRFRHKDRLEVVERKLDALAAHMGVVNWDVDWTTGRNAQNVINGHRKRSLSQLAVYAHVIFTKFFIRSKETYHLSQRRMNMKSKLLSRKFILALATGLLVILNDGLGLGLDTETIMYVVGIVATWILGEAAVDARRKTPEVLPYDAKALDAIRTDSEDVGHTTSN